MTPRERTLVVIPAYNEVATVGAVALGALDAGYDVVVVDDGSTDGTADESRAAGATVLHLPINLGVGGALRCGFRWAVSNGYDTVVQCDADGQHDPDDIAALLRAADEQSAHLLVGNRFGVGHGFQGSRLRRLPMRLLAAVASRAAGRRIADATSGFRVIREPLLSEFARAYPVQYLGDTFEVLVLAGRAGYTVGEVPVVMHERAGGVPSATSGASIGLLIRVLVVLAIGAGHGYRPVGQTPVGSSR